MEHDGEWENGEENQSLKRLKWNSWSDFGWKLWIGKSTHEWMDGLLLIDEWRIPVHRFIDSPQKSSLGGGGRTLTHTNGKKWAEHHTLHIASQSDRKVPGMWLYDKSRNTTHRHATVVYVALISN